MEEPELNRLLNRLIDGSISPEDFERVQARLRHDADARQTYYDLLGVDMLLGELYEVPDYIAVHSQAMDDSWAVHRAKRGMLTWSLLGAAAILFLTLGTFFLFKARPTEITLSATDDSHFSVNGEVRRSGILEPDDSLVLDHGVISLALGPYVEACVEGPAKLRVLDDDGRIELLAGSAFFQVSPGERGFEVHTPAGIIRDIGTKFGVRVMAGGEVETHVTTGAVEIKRTPDDVPHRVNAGEAAKWRRHGSVHRTPIDTSRFIQSLPWQQVLLKDDFSEEDGTPLSGKTPDFGRAWMVMMESSPTRIERQRIDTSYGSRTLSVGFREESSRGHRRVYLATFTTAVPANIGDKGNKNDAAEKLTLWTKEGSALLSLAASSTRDHRWRLVDEHTGKESRGTEVSALDAHTLTVSYDHDTGIVRVFEGPTSQGMLLDKMRIRPNVSPASLTISNAEGGDIALDSVDVRLVAYPQESLSGD